MGKVAELLAKLRTALVKDKQLKRQARFNAEYPIMRYIPVIGPRGTHITMRNPDTGAREEIRIPVRRKQWLKEKAQIARYRDAKKRGCK